MRKSSTTLFVAIYKYKRNFILKNSCVDCLLLVFNYLLGFVMETECVYCAVRNERLNVRN